MVKFGGQVVGLGVRNSIAKTVTYRIRHGNGYAGSELGRRYQDSMTYYTPTNPETEEQEAWRTTFAAGIAIAKALSPEQRQPYIEKAKLSRGRTWLTVFMSDYLLGW